MFRGGSPREIANGIFRIPAEGRTSARETRPETEK